jgi:ketosteroid isomerase-like protein
MSEQDVAVIERLYAELNAGNQRALAEIVADDVQWIGTVGGFWEGRVGHGNEGIQAMLDEDMDAWESIEYRPRRMIDLSGRVIVLQDEVRRGRSSGLELTNETAVIYTLADGKVTRIESFLEQDEALRAAGLDGDPDRGATPGAGPS